MNTKLLINGKFQNGKGAAEQVLDPGTGKVLATVNEASKAQIDAAVEDLAQRSLGAAAAAR
jgi:acyl-CoA reductase-like NAD-dependent aldehyde dehydrogenase